jgi:hypothetical protein
MRKLPLVLIVSVVAIVACGRGADIAATTDEAESSTTVATTNEPLGAATTKIPTTTSPPTAVTTTTSPTSTLEPIGVTIGAIVSHVQQRLDARWAAEPDKPAGVLGPVRVTCAETDRRVTRGDVFACEGVPQTEPDFLLDPLGIVFVVLDDVGTVTLGAGTDMPDATDALWEIHDQAPQGFFCRDLADDETAGFFTTCCGTPDGDYFRALLYWCMQGMPDRMDADEDGIPCETLFSQEAIDEVWSGGAFLQP